MEASSQQPPPASPAPSTPKTLNGSPLRNGGNGQPIEGANSSATNCHQQHKEPEKSADEPCQCYPPDQCKSPVR